MKRLSTLIALLALGLAAIGGSGCNSLFGGSDPAGGTDDAYDDAVFADADLDLDAVYGGYTTEDEQPAFGDPEFAAMFGEDPECGDAMGNAAHVTDMEEDPDARVYYLRLLWGQMELNPDIDEITNWAGTIGVDRGAIVVLRRLAFEPLTDWVVFPREDEKVVDLYSVTSVHHDGLLLKIIDPTPDAAEPNALSVNLGPADIELPVADLDGYAALVDVDALGNQVAFRSPEILDCANGFLHGIWVKRGQAERGIFRGAFTSYGGGLLGHMRGHWGTNDAGEQVFVGKYIARDGSFQGILNGTWTPDGDLPGTGSLTGVWFDENEEAQGQLNGRYRRGHRRGGFYEGRWVDEECGL